MPRDYLKLTFEQVATDWLKKYQKRVCGRTLNTTKCRLRIYLNPRLGAKIAAEIEPLDVLEIAREVEDKGHPEVGRRLITLCSQVFKHGISIGACGFDPCRDIRGIVVPMQSVPRKAITDKNMLAEFLAKLDAYDATEGTRCRPYHLLAKNYIKLLAYLFTRPTELLHATWQEIDFERKEWIIPASRMKMRNEHRIPLCKQVLEIFQEIKDLQLDDEIVFKNSVYKGRGYLSPAPIKHVMEALGYGADIVSMHGFRSTASTFLNTMRYDADVIEKSLAHTRHDVRSIYNRSQYWDERVKMMQDWADWLDKIRDEYWFSLFTPHKKELMANLKLMETKKAS